MNDVQITSPRRWWLSARLLSAILALVTASLLCGGEESGSSQPAVGGTSASAPAGRLPTKADLVALGKGATNAGYLDDDGDGYGVGSPLGPDADPNDPDVNTPESMLAKYGTLNNFLDHLGIAHTRVYFVAPAGSDAAGPSGNAKPPYKTWDRVRPVLHPGDTVIYRGGTYTEGINVGVSGSKSRPITIMAYPGEKVILDRSWPLSISHCSYIVIDGFVVDSSTEVGAYGIQADSSDHITIRNVESRRHTYGALLMQNLHDILIENCVFHDNPDEHGIYVGAAAAPNANITLRGNLLYRNGRNGIQHNGRVKNLLIEGNIIHSNALAGISLMNGVSYSTVRNNLIFNNNKQGIVIYEYLRDPTNPNILPYDQTHNVIENNTIWVGANPVVAGSERPAEHAAILFNNGAHGVATQPAGNLDNNTIRNNILVTYQGPIFEFDQQAYADTTVIENNLLYRLSGTQWAAQSDNIMQYGSKRYNMTEFKAFSPLFQNNLFADPLFKSASIDYNATPEKFAFDLPPNSPGRGMGSPTSAPASDLHGNPRTGPVDAGCYTHAGSE